MPRTYGRIKVEVWESGSDFRALPTEAQWAYQMLVSQPSVTMVGAIAYAPRKWARLAADMTEERLDSLIGVLEQARFVIVDRETDELLIRSFVKHDEPWRLPNNLTGARTQFRAVESASIRGYLGERHPWLEDISIEAEEIKEYERSYGRVNVRSDERENDRGNERTNGVLLADVASDYPEPQTPRAEASGLDTPPAAAHEAAPLGGANVAEAAEEAFEEANRFVVHDGWLMATDKLRRRLREQWPLLNEQDVALLVETAKTVEQREVEA